MEYFKGAGAKTEQIAVSIRRYFNQVNEHKRGTLNS